VVTVEKEGLEFKLHGKREGFFLSWQKAASSAFGTMVFTEREIANHEERKTVREAREAVSA